MYSILFSIGAMKACVRLKYRAPLKTKLHRVYQYKNSISDTGHNSYEPVVITQYSNGILICFDGFFIAVDI